MTAHHAIIPTAVAKPDTTGLSAVERAVYGLVARRYLGQFLAPFEFHETKIEVIAGGELLRAIGRQIVADGWRALIAAPPDDGPRDATEEEHTQPLPLIREGDPATCGDVSISERRTTPPKRFTDATLIQAMTGIARFVDDPTIKQLLRETDGIGTPATQAQIIETLFERHFIEKKGKHVVSTPVGRTLIQALPSVATRPDMTALWEAAMRRIAEGQMPLDAFIAAVLKQLGELVTSARTLGALRVAPGERRPDAGDRRPQADRTGASRNRRRRRRTPGARE